MDLLRCTLKPLCVLLAELMGVMGEWLSVIGTLALILLMKFWFVLALAKTDGRHDRPIDPRTKSILAPPPRWPPA
jgi:hypothetical protein